MPKYVIVRHFDVGAAGMPEVGSRSRRVIEDHFPDITWHHSHIAVEDDGRVRTFCIYEAPDIEAVMAHAKALGKHNVDGVFEIAGDVTPEDFPLGDPV
jgi:Protein of unknown function (DUF4242)